MINKFPSEAEVIEKREKLLTYNDSTMTELRGNCLRGSKDRRSLK